MGLLRLLVIVIVLVCICICIFVVCLKEKIEIKKKEMSYLWAGIGYMIVSWRKWETFLLSVSSDGKFAATPSEIFRSSVPSIYCVVSSVSWACRLIPAWTLVIWHSVCDGAWVCSCISSKNSSNGRAWLWRYTDTLFADKYTPTYWILVTSFFCGDTFFNF